MTAREQLAQDDRRPARGENLARHCQRTELAEAVFHAARLDGARRSEQVHFLYWTSKTTRRIVRGTNPGRIQMRRVLLGTWLFVAGVAVGGLAMSAFGQPYPAKPVRIVIPLGPGSSVEIVTRLV